MKRFLSVLLLAVCTSSMISCGRFFDDIGYAFRKKKIDPNDPTTIPGGPNPPVTTPASTEYLENEFVKVGFNMNYGGSITYFSPAGSNVNMVNNFDLGRQFQYAYYSYPVENYTPNGVKPHPSWTTIGWDPVQTGDAYGNPSQVVSRSRSGNRVVFKTIPKQWGYYNVPCDCSVETTAELNGKALEIKHVLQLARTDTYDHVPRGQELAVAFMNSSFTKVKAYFGGEPFTDGPLVDFAIKTPPFARQDGSVEMYLPESWLYLHNDAGVGLGMWVPQSTTFSTYFLGTPNAGDEFSGNSGVFNSGEMEILDPKMRFETKMSYILGTVDEVRQYAQEHEKDRTQPEFDFSTDRQHWVYYESLDDGQYPFQGEWFLKFDSKITPLWGPSVAWDASKIKKMYLRAAYQGDPQQLRFIWHRQSSPQPYDNYESLSLLIDLIPDGQYHTYEIDLSKQEGWRGNIRRLMIDPGNTPKTGKWLKLKSLTTTQP
ncbi:hypothetical protein [Siphonobacter aquaeclarae]|uniref:Uncharacterized protein n=1 Tax=Siphonobacter aquaeclarae TaxID=563176 RepID=A0A1G9MY04_9BACT|nr:hypothetical protein [Siphonobacter aquaeclarae]SDL79152.1 hypothetical protein SAMN04488090_1790 [Siphonobacter aquaeclarae]